MPVEQRAVWTPVPTWSLWRIETQFPVLGIKPRFLSSGLVTLPVELFPYYKTECHPVSLR